MEPKIKTRALVAILALCATAETPSYNYVGVQGLGIVGAHRDIAGSQYGVGAGPLLQAQVGGKRFNVNVEGIPVVSIPGTRPSVAYGQATPKLGIFNGQAQYALDRKASLWIGLGATIYNQRTPLPAQAQSVSSRLSGVRYTVRYIHPARNGRGIEAFVGVTPTLTGSDVYAFLDGSPPTIRPERASEIDAQVALTWRHGTSEWLFGIRTLNFAARFLDTGEAADRNVGIGPMIEWRHLLR
ncbi:MAG TPA: hypothetical protein VNF68_10335 [Candidatus Baltobacteraceae bacterium]|nr:hypothetical protein [Candidatus Baltobacteraceae bacterium]